jgi:hypothetical protein
MIPDTDMPLASQLYQNAIAMGASPIMAAYLAGSAYQESSFNPNARGDFVNGKPTSFGVMQVGSPSLGSGSVPDQFKNYITALQSKAPDTWAAMNAAPTPQAVHAALHDNPDWRMGIPGARFDNAQQLMGTSGTPGTPGYQQVIGALTSPPPDQRMLNTGGYSNTPAYLDPSQPAGTPGYQQIAGALIAGPPGQQMLNTGGYQNLPAYLAQPAPAAPAAAPQQPSATDKFATNFGGSLENTGQTMLAAAQKGDNQALQQLLSQRHSNPYLNANYPDYTAYLNAQPQRYARGGVVVRRPLYAQGGALVPGRPTAMDSVPAMLSPGEIVFNRQQQQAVQPIRGMASSLRPDQLQALARVHAYARAGLLRRNQ